MKSASKLTNSVPLDSPMGRVAELLKHGQNSAPGPDKAKAVKDLGSTSGTSPPNSEDNGIHLLLDPRPSDKFDAAMTMLLKLLVADISNGEERRKLCLH